jgi:hypothetical protein
LRDDAVDVPPFIKEALSNRSTPDFPKEQPLSATLAAFPSVRRGSADVSGRGSPLAQSSHITSNNYAHGLTGPGIQGTPSPSPPSGTVAFGNYTYGPPANEALRYADSNGAYYDATTAIAGAPGKSALPRVSQFSHYAADHQIIAPAPVTGSASVVASFERGVDKAR